MAHDHLIQQLKRFRAIEPDFGFSEKSRSLILGTKNSPAFSFKWPSFVFASSLSLALIFLVFFGVGLISHGPALSSSLDSQSLSQEFNGLTINLELKKISYEQSVNQAIASAISEISDSETRHLSPTLLESESEGLDFDEPTNPEIDELLNQVLF